MEPIEHGRNPTQERLDADGASEKPVDIPWEEAAMDDKTEGKLKETEGKLTGDKDREAEGKAQSSVGHAKDAASDAAGAVSDKLKDD